MKQKMRYSKAKDISLKVGNFLDQKGFYLVIFLCIIVIVATIAVVSIRDYQRLKINIVSEPQTTTKLAAENEKSWDSKNTEKPVDKAVVGKMIEKPETGNKAVVLDNSKNISTGSKGSRVTVKISSTEKKNEKPNKKVQQADKSGKIISQESKDVQNSNKPVDFDWPVFGKIINEYAKDSLIFSKTLQQWTTHHGVDISGKEGTPVRTAAEGIIKSIKSDPIYGITITIEHKNGTKTIYSNLSTGKMVKVGQNIKRGKVISGIGKTAGFECQDEPHIHFEVIKDEECANPVEYLPRL
ncbi:MAG: peptidoglycan DD-metalloendopeptidase family protein [Deltaproteobacteria bacterium]